MQTLANSSTACKPAPKAFYGFLDTEHGVFTMLDGVVVFMASTTEELRIVERGMAWQMCGEVGVCETQQIIDRLHGGAAWIATHRAQEVA
jgi:hypothetical protein